MAHWSHCATNNGPALPVGPCDCGNDAPETNVVQFRTKRLTGFIPEVAPYGGAGIDGIFIAPEKDPA